MNTDGVVGRIIDDLTCPVSFQPLTEAVTLFPCGDKTQQEVAVGLYGPMQGSSCEKKNQACITCGSKVCAYYPDIVIRQIVTNFFSLEKQEKELEEQFQKLTLQEVSKAKNIAIEGVIDDLTCPVSFDPLKKAVTLEPCNHKVNEEIASKKYGAEKKEPCIKCRTPVQAYYPDPVIQRLATNLFSLGDDEELKDRFTQLITHTTFFASRKKSYPGNKAVFIHSKGSLDISKKPRRSYPVLFIKFKSSSNDSLFKSLTIVGYADGNLRVRIRFNGTKQQQLQLFFEEEGIASKCVGPQAILCTAKEDISQLADIIDRYNTLPEAYHKKIISLLREGLLLV